MSKTIWFNHWFSSAYNLINMFRKSNNDIKIIGSNKQINSAIKMVCDEWYDEPSPISPDSYVDWCISFCKEHNVDIFVPRRNITEISKNVDRFKEINVLVMVDDYKLVKLLNDKGATYEMFKDIPDINVPSFEVVNNVDDFKRAYEQLKTIYSSICIKFVKDEGAMSFRKIIDDDESFNSLRMYQGAKIEYDRLLRLLSQKTTFDDLIIMPYLDGSEVSVDCLNTNIGLIAIPRRKSCSRHEFIEYDDDIMRMTGIISKKLSLKCPYNIQFRYDNNNVPYLLEINTRMSGGLYLSCDATGINIPDLAIKQLCGYKLQKMQFNRQEHIVSHMESAIIVK